MASLNLTPNEIVGYKIIPDMHSFNVQLVKRRGASSKQAGQEYGEILGYCASLESASNYIVQHATRVYGKEMQIAEQSVTGSVGDALALAKAIGKAQTSAMHAIKELRLRIDALGLDRKGLVLALGGATDAPEAPVSPED